ncbi:unnamed protein product [Discula destructiva]
MSSQKYENVIVFGPTGAVGGCTALEAGKRGAKVWLAMRNPAKTIEDIPAEVEKTGPFERVQADLTDPASITAVVKKTGAKAVYIYWVRTEDHMRASLQALRDGGVEYVVFLSSYSLEHAQEQGRDIHTVESDDFIPWSHAQVEIGLEKLGFPHVISLRPSQFASNYLKHFLDTNVKPARIRYIYEDGLADYITPEDIGRVGGALLSERPYDGKQVIALSGPKLWTYQEGLALFKKITGREDINTIPSTRAEFIDSMVSLGLPVGIGNYLAQESEGMRDRELWFPKDKYAVNVANIKKYGGKEPLTFEEYLEKHKSDWDSIV